MFGLSQYAESWVNFGIVFGLVLIIVAIVLYWHSRRRR
jgi:hypothetical protein